MALKDLVAQKAALTEEAIEKIIADYVRYDTDEMEIAFTPGVAGLNKKAKILIYLVALEGWQFVVEEAVGTTAKPAELEETLGIPGGSLRPILKDLKDRHLVSVKSGAYSVRATNLESIHQEIERSSSPKPRVKKASKKSKTRSKAASESKPKQSSTKRSAGKKNSEISDKFDSWIKAGYFDTPRTARDVQDRFHKKAVIIQRTSIPQYLLKAVRNDQLERSKKDVSGKQVWAYQTKQT